MAAMAVVTAAAAAAAVMALGAVVTDVKVVAVKAQSNHHD